MSEQIVFGDIEQPTPQDVSNFLWRAMQYIKERRPYDLTTIAILNEKCYDIMDEEFGRQRELAIQ
jgi:hypothetical protein